MAGRRKRVKAVDKWKLKRWYTVTAPQVFDGKEIGEVVSADPNNLINRVIEVPLFDVAGAAGGVHAQTAMFTSLRFRIVDVSGQEAKTKFIGHQISPAFIKTFARRGRTVLHHVLDEKTKDGETVRLKLIAVTGSRVSQNTKTNLRKMLEEETRKFVRERNFDDVVREVVFGKLSSHLFSKLSTITKMRRVEVRKTERHEVFK